jgi:hypothetical protein
MVPTPTDLAQLRSRWERSVVVRRIDRPLGALFLADVHAIGALAFTRSFVGEREGPAALLHAPGVVYLRRLVLPAAVEVQVVEWSRHSSELRIVPDSRQFELWGEHRRRRYFDLAHDAADRLVGLLAGAKAAA